MVSQNFFLSDITSMASSIDEMRRLLQGLSVGNGGAHDGEGFVNMARDELQKILTELRNKSIEKARAAGAGSASTAISRRLYKNGIGGNINIATSKKKKGGSGGVMSESYGGASGSRRNRNVSARTIQIRSYTGMDRAFILRWLNEGTDVRTTEMPDVVGRGSGSTYGRRGAIAPRSFFGETSDLDSAARTLSGALIEIAERYIQDNTR